MDIETVRFIVGVIGNIISFFLFLSPAPTFLQIIKKKSVQAFKPDPYLATVLNCAMWVFYGMPFVHPDSILVITINGFGLAIEILYISIFFIYSTWGGRKKMSIILVVETIFFVVLAALTLSFAHTHETRSMIVGLICIVFNILMYASPLTVMKMVIKTKSVKYMPFWLSIANLLNGIVWVIYALCKFDPYILIPNGLGVISGIIQVSLYATYYKTTNWDEEVTPGDVQMTDNASRI